MGPSCRPGASELCERALCAATGRSILDAPEEFALRTIEDTLRLPRDAQEDLAGFVGGADLRAAAARLMAESRPLDEDSPSVEALLDRLLARFVRERSEAGRPTGHLWFFPEPFRFAAFLSHDVDEVEWSWRRRLLMAARHPTSFLSEDRRYWNFDRVVDQERRLGIASTFFVVPMGGHRRDPPYALADIVPAIRALETAGWEVGLHASYESYDEPEAIASQSNALAEVLGHPPAGVRQHYLNFAPPSTWEFQERAGLRYDTSMGSRERAGFRVGFCHPYRPEGRRLLEIPISAMDSQLFWYEGRDEERAYERTMELAQTVARFGGVLSLNWHQHVMDDWSFPGWWGAYTRCLEALLPLAPWFVQGVHLARWWEHRASVELRERSVSADSGQWDVMSPAGGRVTLRLFLPEPTRWRVKVEGLDGWRAFARDGATWVQLTALAPGASVRISAEIT